MSASSRGAARDMRSALARAKGAGGLPEGPGHWKVERVSAVLLAPLSLWAAAQLLRLAGRDRAAILDWAGKPGNAAPLAVLIALTARHAQLGLEVIATDYSRGRRRIAIRFAIRFAALLLVAYSGASLVRIMQERAGQSR